MNSLLLSQKYPKKRAFITGAASGLGLAFCLQLAKDGWTIGMSDVNVEALKTAEAEVQAAGGTTLTYELDVADRQQYAAVVEAFLEKTGGIDLLINNAGVAGGGPMGVFPLEDWDWMTDINQNGVINGCHFFVPHFKQQESGHIINVASAAAFTASPNMAVYNVTKAAVRALSETLYYELAPYHIGVSTLMPTFFPTNIMENARGSERLSRFAKKMMERSTTDATTVALETLTKAGKGQLEIILPKEARKTYLLKRLFPGLYRKKLLKLTKGLR